MTVSCLYFPISDAYLSADEGPTEIVAGHLRAGTREMA